MAEILDIVVRQRGARTVARDIAKIATAADQGGSSLQRLQRQVTATGTASQRAARQVGASAVATAGLGRAATGASASLSQLAAGATIVGGAVTAGILVPLASAVNIAGDFEAALNRVQNVARATPEQIDRIRESAEELGITTAFSATQAAQGFEFLARAGLDVQQQLGAIRPALNLAAAGNLELAESSNIVTNIVSGFRLEIGQLGDAADILTRTAQSSNTDIRLLGDAFSFVAPRAAALGQDFLDINVAIGALGNAGIQGSRAGRNLGAALASLADPTDSGAAALERLGVQVFDAEGQFRSILDIVADLGDATRGLSDEARASAIGDIFSEQGARAIQALLGQGDAIERLRGQVGDFAGAAQEAADTQLRGFNGALRELRSALEGAGISIGDTLLRPLEFLIRGVTQLVRSFAELPSSVQATVAAFASAVGAVGALTAALGALAFAANAAGINLDRLGGIAAGLRGAFAAAARGAVGLVAALGPVGLIAGAIAGALFLLRDVQFELGGSTVSLSSLVQAAWENIQGTVQAAIDTVIGAVDLGRQAFADFLAFLGPFGQRVQDALSDISFQDVLAGFLAFSRSGLAILRDFLERAGLALGGFASDLTDLFRNIPAALRAAASGDFSEAGAILAGSFQSGFQGAFDDFSPADIVQEEFERANAQLDALGQSNLFRRAAEIEAQRTAAAAAGQGPGAAATVAGGGAGGGAATPRGTGTLGLEASEIESRATALASLTDQLDQVAAAERQLAEARVTLNEAVEAGLIPQAEANRLLELASERTRQALLDTEQFTDQLSTRDALTQGAAEGFRRFSDSLGNEFTVIRDGIQGAFDGGLNALNNFVQTGEFSFRSFAQSAVGALQQIITKLLVIQATEFFTGGGGGGGGGFGGILGGIAGAFGGGGGLGGIIGGIGSLFGSFFGGARQTGGVVNPNQAFLVGEDGPEMFQPPTSGRVLPNSAIGAGMAPAQPQIQIVNVDDATKIPEAMNTREGEAAIMNVIQRNRGTLKEVIS